MAQKSAWVVALRESRGWLAEGCRDTHPGTAKCIHALARLCPQTDENIFDAETLRHGGRAEEAVPLRDPPLAQSRRSPRLPPRLRGSASKKTDYPESTRVRPAGRHRAQRSP